MSMPSHLTHAEIEEFGREIEAVRTEVMDSRGESDARYIHRLIKVQRSLALGGRLVIYASLAFLPQWSHALAGPHLFWPVIALGTLMLGCAKILENMEIGHNISHAQWDWLRDPAIQSGSWEWDHVCPSDQWKHSHNVKHHTWTNVFGKDADVGGYGLLRLFSAQRWRPFNLGNPVYALVLALLFEWGIAIQELELGRIWSGRQSFESIRGLWEKTRAKMARQILKDYILFPLLAGPFFLIVCGANAVANVIRNLWTYLIIFCGHFPMGVHVFTKDEVENETRPRWYVRQLLGSCNIGGGKLFHIMSGNLSHQIEHHLFPDMPSNRYPEVAPRVRALCVRYRLPYNTGSLTRQFGTTVLRILRMTFPGHSTFLDGECAVPKAMSA
ncbi:fatty acid desaturase family protein [Massilia glaciei]|uniref:Acyl-CoA desaturase n=2 Tax=Pseudomonadati TaxID=3379134 RepID=A0A2U2I6G9_9BURK|nr:acyl-CoA desaturase [Massilia glaciei]PWF55332.1 acyl-CoA desaturase [Massilia glaciei]